MVHNVFCIYVLNYIVISGKDKGKQGQVLAVSPKEGKVIVAKVNMVSKHVKPRKMGEQGGIVKACLLYTSDRRELRMCDQRIQGKLLSFLTKS